MSKQKILSRRDVCASLGISPATLWRWCQSGLLPEPIRLGPNRVGWPVDEIEDWIERRRAKRAEARSTKEGLDYALL